MKSGWVAKMIRYLSKMNLVQQEWFAEHLEASDPQENNDLYH